MTTMILLLILSALLLGITVIALTQVDLRCRPGDVNTINGRDLCPTGGDHDDDRHV